VVPQPREYCVGKARRFKPAGFSLVFAAGVEPLMVRLWFPHSLARWTQPLERNEKPIAARRVFECEEE
jgi:hypothetical protein